MGPALYGQHYAGQVWNDNLSQYGLRFNIKKTEYLETNPSDGNMLVSGKALIKTYSFKYLGLCLQRDGGINN